MANKLMTRAVNENVPETDGAPVDWRDKKEWDRYHHQRSCAIPFEVPARVGAPGWESVRFLDLVRATGRRIWFPGCGTDVGPRFYAGLGYKVLATDFSPVATRVQRKLAALPPERVFTGWAAFVRQSDAPIEASGQLDVAEHDFTTGAPNGVFDVMINRRAFQGLSASAMLQGARNFFAALRPGGVAIIDTMNVQGDLRNVIEDSLATAGFFLPFSDSERWYRTQLASTRIPFGMIMGRPRVRYNRQNSSKSSMAAWEHDQIVLDSFAEEYKARLEAERPFVEEISRSAETIVAHVIYATG